MENKTQLENIELALKRINEGENKIIFYVGHSVNGNTVASVLTTYKYALYLHNQGHQVIMLHDKDDYKVPTWIGEEFSVLKHLSLESGRLKVSVVDIVIYPETHPDVMEKTRKLNCTKVVLCQSHKNILPSLPPGVEWTSFDIDFVIVVSDNLRKYVKSIFHIDDIFIRTIEPSVDDELFYDDEETYRCPIVPVVSRSQADTLLLAKEFYLKYPEHKMVSFRDMRAFSMEEYATTLNEAFLGVWLDREASFGQFPVEALKSNLQVVALRPEMASPYELENVTWVDSRLEMCSHIFEALIDYINEPLKKFEVKEEIYTVDTEREKVIALFESLIGKKKNELNELKERING